MRLMAYNIEWFTRAFNSDNTLKSDADSVKKLDAVAAVIDMIDPDLIGVTEAPNTTASSGGMDTVTALEGFAAVKGLRQSKTITGFTSQGEQEIALMFDPAVVTATHDPGGSTTSKTKPTFNRQFEIDSDGDDIKELYRHFRPPLEAKVTRADGGADFWVIVAHAKSKGIFDNTDRLNFDRISAKNRRKLFAECSSIRNRVEEYLDAGRPTVVMGDINDGPGFDFYEERFGRSAVEIIMGDPFEPDRILRNHVGRPKWGKFGWEPASARFTDTFTHDPVNVLIDHIMASREFTLAGDGAKVWNPFELKFSQALKTTFRDASDHFPVTLDIA